MDKSEGIGTQSVIEGWRDFEGIFPFSLGEIYDSFVIDFPEEIDELEPRFFIDAFSEKREWVLYVPLYAEDSDSIETYILLSAGIDGKLDNIISDKKLTRNNWKELLDLYNPEEFEPINTKPHFENCKFKLRDYWFGSKDLLIFDRDKIYINIDNEDQN